MMQSIQKYFPHITNPAITDDEKESIFKHNNLHSSIDINESLYLLVIDNEFIGERPDITTKQLNDLKILGQQNIWVSILHFIYCFYIKTNIFHFSLMEGGTKDVSLLGENKYKEMVNSLTKIPIAEIDPAIQMETFFYVSNTSLSVLWKRISGIVCIPFEFILALFAYYLYVDILNNKIYFLWNISWQNDSVKNYYNLLISLNKDESNIRATEEMINAMQKYVYKQSFNDNYPLSLSALVNYFKNIFEKNQVPTTISNLINKINENISEKINSNASDADISAFIASNHVKLTAVQKVTEKANEIATSVGQSASVAGEQIRQNASNVGQKASQVATNVGQKASQVATHVGQKAREAVSSISNTLDNIPGNVSDKMVAGDEILTVGSAATVAALIATLLGGKRKTRKIRKMKKNMQRKKTNNQTKPTNKRTKTINKRIKTKKNKKRKYKKNRISKHKPKIN